MSGISELDKMFSALLKEFPNKQRAFHARVGALVERKVQQNLESSLKTRHPQTTASRRRKRTGRISKGQRSHVGSGGGYAAIRPIGKQAGGGYGSNSIGAVTNYLEGGHKIRTRKNGKRRRVRIKNPYVNGFHFYRETRNTIESEVYREGERFVNELIEKVESS